MITKIRYTIKSSKCVYCVAYIISLCMYAKEDSIYIGMEVFKVTSCNHAEH